MKLTAVFLTVMLLMAGMLFVGVSCVTKEKSEAHIAGDKVLPEISAKEEKATPVPKDAPSPRVARVKVTKPRIKKIEIKDDSFSCGGVMSPPLKDTSERVMIKVEIAAEYPGGPAAWQRFLNRNLRYPEEDIDNGVPGSAVAQFVVDRDGNVSNVEAICGSAALGAELVRLIKKSGKWIPASQGGRQVKSLKKLPLMIHPEVEE